LYEFIDTGEGGGGTYPNQSPRLILSLSITRFTKEGAVLPSHWLSNASTNEVGWLFRLYSTFKVELYYKY